MSHQTKHIMPLSFSLLIAGTNGAQAVNPQSQEQDAQPPPSAGRRQGQGPGDQRGRPLFGKITAINANSLELAVLVVCPVYNLTAEAPSLCPRAGWIRA